jgi:superfamily I DNA/RNA helicase
VELSRGQRAVVEHEVGAGPCRVVGDFGTGKSAALRARAARLRDEGRRPLLLSARPSEVTAFAVELLRRHGRPVSILGLDEQVAMVASMVDERLRPSAPAVAAMVSAFQASFLGDEELRVHADAAGCLDEAEELIGLTSRYLAALSSRYRVDAGGAVVQASLLLRDPEVLAAERSRFDEVLVDDFQLASFGTNRLLSQLVGFGGAVTVAGNEEAAVSSDPLSSPAHLARFDRRFGAALDVTLTPPSLRSPGVPTLRIVESDDEARQVAAESVAAAEGMGLGLADTAIVTRDVAEAAVGREWPVVVVPEATEGRWPAAARPSWRWLDPELLSGPDVPSDDERDRRWLETERRRFRVATTRATRFLVVIGQLPVSRFVGELVR